MFLLWNHIMMWKCNAHASSSYANILNLNKTKCKVQFHIRIKECSSLCMTACDSSMICWDAIELRLLAKRKCLLAHVPSCGSFSFFPGSSLQLTYRSKKKNLSKLLGLKGFYLINFFTPKEQSRYVKHQYQVKKLLT